MVSLSHESEEIPNFKQQQPEWYNRIITEDTITDIRQIDLLMFQAADNRVNNNQQCQGE